MKQSIHDLFLALSLDNLLDEEDLEFLQELQDILDKKDAGKKLSPNEDLLYVLILSEL